MPACFEHTPCTRALSMKYFDILYCGVYQKSKILASVALIHPGLCLCLPVIIGFCFNLHWLTVENNLLREHFVLSVTKKCAKPTVRPLVCGLQFIRSCTKNVCFYNLKCLSHSRSCVQSSFFIKSSSTKHKQQVTWTPAVSPRCACTESIKKHVNPTSPCIVGNISKPECVYILTVCVGGKQQSV